MKMLSSAQVRAKLGGVSKTCLYDYVKRRGFPGPVKLFETRSVWIESEVDAWLEARIAEHRAATAAGEVPFSVKRSQRALAAQHGEV
ncbi:AlpA family phage regulatory protein [Burkholderia vietnamiensis]|uniref:AlpA family phage regulatory protein n=1 Tax=Burkholderia vietnamiensis TaxID=60552 RepID=UPI001B9F85B4|nr:AlpA family phage regulatory protein [Burkholderia vietnamiensis]MBR8000344.1 AlpA family phage regulatory protein [Burkholderia vietnamiensis]